MSAYGAAVVVAGLAVAVNVMRIFVYTDNSGPVFDISRWHRGVVLERTRRCSWQRVPEPLEQIARLPQRIARAGGRCTSSIQTHGRKTPYE